jgi:hypothetical protein
VNKLQKEKRRAENEKQKLGRKKAQKAQKRKPKTVEQPSNKDTKVKPETGKSGLHLRAFASGREKFSPFSRGDAPRRPGR